MHSKHILIVEDEPAVAATLKMVLSHKGYSSQHVANAKEALKIFAPGKFGIILTDLTLPGMNGLAFACAIKAQTPDQPIILITAYSERMIEEGENLACIDALLSKPFELPDLVQALAKVSKHGPTSAAL